MCAKYAKNAKNANLYVVASLASLFAFSEQYVYSGRIMANEPNRSRITGGP